MTALSPNAAAVPHSGIREIVDLATQRKPGEVIRLEIGEPSAPTPPHIVTAAVAAASARTGYTASAGIRELREVAGARVALATGLTVKPEQVVIGQGAVQLLSAAMAALVGPGDEVLIPDPAWPNYEMQTLLYGGRPVRYPLRPENGFLPDALEIEALMSSRTRVLIVNSPSNPTGKLIDRAVAEQLVRAAERHGVTVLSDEVYDQIVFDDEHVSLAAIAPQSVVSIFSLSKTYSMTGWRIGYAAFPAWLGATVAKLQEAFISSLPVASQAAAMAALTGPSGSIAANLADYRSRRDSVLADLAAMDLAAPVPGGAFYLLAPLAEGADSRRSALDLVDHGVSMAPGTAFGTTARSFLRISLASTTEDLTEGVRRYRDWYEATDGGLALGTE
ncbi:MAG: aminotransferase class I/II-fold pyridoxal phosphate-dependent enzyme [Actinomycetota bacterium]